MGWLGRKTSTQTDGKYFLHFLILRCNTPHICLEYISFSPRKRTVWNVRPMTTQISLHTRAVWPVFVVCMKKLCVLGLAIRNRPNEDSDQTARMSRLIRLIAERKRLKVPFSDDMDHMCTLIIFIVSYVGYPLSLIFNRCFADCVRYIFQYTLSLLNCTLNVWSV